ncbi:MAG: Ig-like domain repeat protein [Anaerolineales bacterium]|nr:Ig-like domain repeat protein [Anaerolineales bacterium]
MVFTATVQFAATSLEATDHAMTAMDAVLSAPGTTAGLPQPTGTVIFAENGVEFRHAAPSQWVVTIAYGQFPAGTHSITAQYTGDTRFTGSTSAPYQQVVRTAPTAVNDAASTAWGTSVTIPVLANDQDPAVGTDHQRSGVWLARPATITPDMQLVV